MSEEEKIVEGNIFIRPSTNRRFRSAPNVVFILKVEDTRAWYLHNDGRIIRMYDWSQISTWIESGWTKA